MIKFKHLVKPQIIRQHNRWRGGVVIQTGHWKKYEWEPVARRSFFMAALDAAGAVMAHRMTPKRIRMLKEIRDWTILAILSALTYYWYLIKNG